jgi:DNA-binding NarL/FixJ family response regulator
LIIDDHPSFRASARNVLEDAGFVVIGEAQDGASGLAAATVMRPTVVLLDVQLPDIDGFDVAAWLTSQDDGPAVVLTPAGTAASSAGWSRVVAPGALYPRTSCRGLRSRRSSDDRGAPGTDRRWTPHDDHGATCMRIVLGEDSVLLREGIARLLGDAGFEVVAQAGDAEDLLRKVRAHKPDVAIVDIRMPRGRLAQAEARS